MEHDAIITESIGWFNTDDILFDVYYTLFPIEDVLTLTEGTKVDSFLLEGTTLTVTLVNGDVVETLTKEVEIKPMKVYHYQSMACRGATTEADGYMIITLYPDGTKETESTYPIGQQSANQTNRFSEDLWVRMQNQWEPLETKNEDPNCPTGYSGNYVVQRIE